MHTYTNIVVQAGDALFIPEGWWHQVDSQPTTIAVNFWWKSAFTKGLRHAHMQQYYLRRLLDGVLDTERCRALASVQPHPTVQALQAAVETVVGAHDQPSDTTSSGSSDSSSATAETPDTSTSSEAATAAKSVDQTAESAAEGRAQKSPQDAGIQHGQDQSSIQRGLPASAHVRQSQASLLDAHGSCKPGRKRKAADMSDGCGPDQGDMMYQEHLQVQPPSQRDTLVSGSEDKRLLAPHSSIQQATSRQLEQDNAYPPQQGDISATSNSLSAAGTRLGHGKGMSAAQKPPPQQAEGSTAEAGCSSHQEPLHMACMRLLAVAVADHLDRPDPHDNLTGG